MLPGSSSSVAWPKPCRANLAAKQQSVRNNKDKRNEQNTQRRRRKELLASHSKSVAKPLGRPLMLPKPPGPTQVPPRPPLLLPRPQRLWPPGSARQVNSYISVLVYLPLFCLNGNIVTETGFGHMFTTPLAIT